MGKTIFVREPAPLSIKRTPDGTRIMHYAGDQLISSLREVSIAGTVFKVLAEIRPVLNENYGTDNEEAMTIYHVLGDEFTVPIHEIGIEIIATYYTVRIP